MEFTVDGSHSLEEQQDALHFQELKVPCLLVSYTKGEGATLVPGSEITKTLNYASFNPLPLGQDVPDLFLIEVSGTASVASVIAEQLAKDRKLIFCSPVFVLGKEKMVAGFR